MDFNKAAHKWDTEERIKRAKVLASSISNLFTDAKHMNALEIGCGTGLLTLNLQNTFNEIYCMDTSEEMIKALSKKIQENNFNNIHILSDDIIKKDEFNKKFDVIYSSMVFHHIENIQDELKMLYSFLNKNGYLIIIDLDEDDGSFHKNEKEFHGHNGFKREYMKELLEKCDFKDIIIKTIYNGEKKLDGKTLEYSLFLCISKI